MHGKTHATMGALAGLSAATFLGETDPARLASATALGALAGLVPDWFQVNMPWMENLKGTWGHRGFSHWLWTAGLAAWLIYPHTGTMPALAFLAGWLSHLLLDMLAGGIPLLWPLKRITWGKVKTGGKIDKATGGAALAVLIILTLYNLNLYIGAMH